jgi:hypothetical protein
MVTFVELPLFTDQITRLVDDADYLRFQKDLLRRPDRGDVIAQSGGLRKARMRLPGRGKSGGARVIYLHLPKHDTIVLFYLYTKTQRENLSAEQLHRLRDAAGVIKREFRA